MTSLPMRAKLISVSGDGNVVVELNPEIASNFNVQGTDGTTLEIYFNQFGEHTADISYASAVNHGPVANAQSFTTPEGMALAITLTGSDPDGDPLTFQVTSNPLHGALSGTAPNLSYTPYAGFSFVVNDGFLNSAPATVTINVTATDGGNQGISNYTNGITVDGDLLDWARLVSFRADADDVSGGNNYLDWRESWMAHDDDNFYIAIRNDTTIELSWAYNIYIDTDGDSLTGFNDASAFPIGAEYLMQGGYLYQYTGDGSSWSWNFVAALTQAVKGQAAEFVIPHADIGNLNSLRLFFYGENAVYLSGAPLDLYTDQALVPYSKISIIKNKKI